jgi:phosphatidylinositol glycan class A protein
LPRSDALNGVQVIIVTHYYGNRKGIRYMTNGLKVYYLPITQIYNQSTLPELGIMLIPILRKVLIREKIDIVHCHQAFSSLGNQTLVMARSFEQKRTVLL